MNLVHRFNLVVRWIVTQIVQAQNSSKREAIIAKWIDIANVLHTTTPQSVSACALNLTSRPRLDQQIALPRTEQLQRSQ
jgi:hypothetical protein